jgi:S-(hydroxymethyl)glutathione dehydrogenase/alcohol dehydrogenase
MGAFILAGRQVADQTARHHAMDGTDIGVMSAIGTFCPYTIANEASVIKILPDIPLDKAALVGCGVPTGWGSATYAADVQPGETVVVVGLGGVGANAVQGAAMAGAQYIVAIDPNAWKHDAIKVFGATHTASSMAEAASVIADLTWGMMADKVILTVGEAEGSLIAPLMSLVKKGGRAVVTAAGSMFRTDVDLNLCELTMSRKELVGTCYGNCNPRYDIPRLLRMYMEGQLKIDELVTKTYSLEDINTGYDDMRNGRNFRGMLLY